MRGDFAFRALSTSEPWHHHPRPLDCKPPHRDGDFRLSGFAMLRQLEVELDYRDGLVDFKYDPKRVNPLAR